MGLASATPILLNGIPVSAFAENLPIDISCIDGSDRCVVLIQLSGGNDGLNTLIPLDQYATYQNYRPNIKIGENEALKLQVDPNNSSAGNRDDVALHIALSAFKQYFNKEDNTGIGMSVIQNVGYPLQNKSHFKSTDIILAGMDGVSYGDEGTDGWVAKYLYNQHTDDIIMNNLDDPIAIQLGDVNPGKSLIHTYNVTDFSLNLSGQNPLGLFSVTNLFSSPFLNNVPISDHGDVLNHVKSVETELEHYSDRITQVFSQGANSPTVQYPSVSISFQLKTIAKLISGGCKSKVFICKMRAFDHHVSLVENHNERLTALNDSIEAFYKDLSLITDDLGNKYSDRVLTSTFSEFGRKVKENGNKGTDHGLAFPMFVFGKGVKNKFHGSNANLSDLTPDFQINGMQNDYRTVFTTILQDWLGANNSTIDEVFQKSTPDDDGSESFISSKLDLIEDMSKSCIVETTQADSQLKQFIDSEYKNSKHIQVEIYPNPITTYFTASIECIEGEEREEVNVEVVNALGQIILSRKVTIEEGQNVFQFDIARHSGLGVFKVYQSNGTLIEAINLIFN